MWIISCLYGVSSTPEYVFLSEDGTFTILSGANINESTGMLNNHSYLKFGCSAITDLTFSGNVLEVVGCAFDYVEAFRIGV